MRNKKDNSGGGGGGVSSINGNSSAAQFIAAGAGISVLSAGGTTTITNTGANLWQEIAGVLSPTDGALQMTIAPTKLKYVGSVEEGGGTTASGLNSHAEGGGSQATGVQSHSEGAGSAAHGDNSHTEGNGTKTWDAQAHAEGGGTTAIGPESHAEGAGNNAYAQNSHVEGNGGSQTGIPGYAFSITGLNGTISGQDVVAYMNHNTDMLFYDLFGGTNNTLFSAHRTLDTYSFNGTDTIFTLLSPLDDRTNGIMIDVTNGVGAHAEGGGSRALADNSHAEGGGTLASGSQAHSEGGGTVASGSQAHSEGGGTLASGDGAHAEGGGCQATNTSAHAEGGGTFASGSGAHSEGGGTFARGDQAHSEGGNTFANAQNSHTEGGGTTAWDAEAHAEGGGTTAIGVNSHAEGNTSTTFADNSHAEGSGTTGKPGYPVTFSGTTATITGQDATVYLAGNSNPLFYNLNGGSNNTLFTTHKTISNIVFGGVDTTFTIDSPLDDRTSGIVIDTNIGQYAHAEGAGTGATGTDSHAEGGGTLASGNQSHSEGGGTVASGSTSHAEGGSTLASGDVSHAQGSSSIASGNTSFAAGVSANAIHDYSTVICDSNGATSTTTDELTLSFANGIKLIGETSVVIEKFSATTAPGTPPADSMVMYLTASGVTPNRVVSLNVMDETGAVAIIHSVTV